MNSDQSATPVCGDCGESLDGHCIVWPQEGDPFLQCQPGRVVTASGRRKATDRGSALLGRRYRDALEEIAEKWPSGAGVVARAALDQQQRRRVHSAECMWVKSAKPCTCHIDADAPDQIQHSTEDDR